MVSVAGGRSKGSGALRALVRPLKILMLGDDVTAERFPRGFRLAAHRAQEANLLHVNDADVIFNSLLAGLQQAAHVANVRFLVPSKVIHEFLSVRELLEALQAAMGDLLVVLVRVLPQIVEAFEGDVASEADEEFIRVDVVLVDREMIVDVRRNFRLKGADGASESLFGIVELLDVAFVDEFVEFQMFARFELLVAFLALDDIARQFVSLVVNGESGT